MSGVIAYVDGPVPVLSPLDTDSVETFRFDWTDWLSDIGVADIDEVTFDVSAGLVKSDGVTAAIKKGKTSVPPPATISSGVTQVHVWVDTTPTNSWGRINCHVRAGTQMLDQSALFKIVDR